MIKIHRLSIVCLTLVISFVHRTHEFGFNPLTFVKNWSLKGSASFPMPSNFLDTNRLIMREGYGWEKAPVETADGYLLQLTRILPRTPFTGKRPPIMLVHGLISTSETWVSRGRFQDLAFILTELGFDVWLPDLRGNHYGKRHKYISPSNPRFWDFSFHEIGVYDIPACIDVILEKTGASKVAYVGHSMGTTVFFVMASLRPQYNNKISAAVLLAPVASKFPFDEIVNPATRVALTQFSFVFGTLKSAGIYEILPRTPRLVYNVKKYCTRQPEQDYCLDFIGSFYGEHRANLDRKHFGDQISYIPAGASLRTVHHFAQVFNYGFHMYDYGMKTNKLKYNSTVPPAYPLQRITAPIMLMHGSNDLLTSAQGVAFLRDMIPGVRKVVAVPDYKFTHVDFVYGVNTNDTVYPFLIDFLTERIAIKK